jgi:diguanylate cyclase (GGDEF)-like protein
MKEIYIDELTGCYNRRFLHYWIENEIKRSNRYATKFTLILLDIDNFRDINNNFGHLEGDRVLIEFTEFLRKNIREVDNLVRYGGDEFIILVPNTNSKGALELAQRLFSNLNDTKILRHIIRCSIGFSVFPDDGTTAETVISQADDLMYQAKKQGKNQIGLRQKIVQKLQIPSPITIGREDEAHWILTQLKEYTTIFIAGEIGVGKTRLVLEIKDRLNTDIILRGNAYAALSSVPYHPFKNMFSELINKNFALVQRVFKQLPEIYQAEVMKLLPTEGILKAVQIEGLDKYRLYNAVAEFISKMSHMASPTTTMLLLDDLHWIDRPSCELLDFLIRSIKNNIKIFGTYRVEEIKTSQLAEFLGIWAREKFYTQMTVSPLNEKQTNQLLKAMMGSVPQSVSKFIYHQSGGNPFYVEEIVRELERQKKLYWNGKEWVFVKHLEVAVPRSIEETIKRKLKFLDPDHRMFLEIAAVYGQEFVADIIAMASKRNVGEILHAIDELRRLGFIKERTGESFFFSEDVVRQIVYKNISRADLMRYHNIVGETIENFYRGSLPNYYEQLALHFTIANDDHRALEYSKEAATKAKANYAHSLAVKFFENALKYEDNIEEIFNMKFSLAEIHFLTGHFKKAIEELKTCLKIHATAYRVYDQLGKVYQHTGDYKNSLKYYRLGLKLVHGTDSTYAFSLAISMVYTRLGQHLRAKKECEKMLKKKSQMSRQHIGSAYLILGVVALRLLQFNRAELYFKKALKIREENGNKTSIAACYINLAITYQEKLNIKACEDYYKKALKINQEIGYQGGIVTTLLDLGVLYADYDLPKAEEYYLKALSISKIIGTKRHTILLFNNLGDTARHRLMDDQALANYKRALKLAKEIKSPEGILFAHISMSEFYRDKGQTKKGKQHLISAQRIASKINLKYYTLLCMMEELNYLLSAEDTKKVTVLSKKLLAQSKSVHNLNYKIYGLIYRGRIMVKLKKYAKAHYYYNKAYNFVKSLPKNRYAGEIFYFKGIAYQKEQKLKEALRMFVQASRIFESVGNLRFLDKIEEEITKTYIK